MLNYSHQTHQNKTYLNKRIVLEDQPLVGNLLCNRQKPGRKNKGNRGLDQGQQKKRAVRVSLARTVLI